MKRKLRIAYFAEIFPSKSETWVHNEILELQKLGHEVKVFSTWEAPEIFAPELEEFYSITVYKKPLNVFRMIKIIPSVLKTIFIPQVLKAFLFDNKELLQRAQVIRDCFILYSLLDVINKFKPDLTYAHFAATRANLSFLYKAITSVPYIIKIHAGDVFGRTAMFASKVNESLRVYSISKYNIDFVLNRENNLGKDKLMLNHCGLNPDTYPFNPHKIHKEQIEIVTVGRLVRMKGFDILIDACKELVKNTINFNVTIIGNGPLKQNLQDQIKHLGLKDYIVLKDYCTPTEIRQYLNYASVFVLPCRFDTETNTQDGIPVALMEAMAIGTPVLSTTVSGIPELIHDNVNGFIVPPDNPLLLSQKILSVLRMEESELKKIVMEARKKIEVEFNVYELTRELVKDVESHLLINNN